LRDITKMAKVVLGGTAGGAVCWPNRELLQRPSGSLSTSPPLVFNIQSSWVVWLFTHRFRHWPLSLIGCVLTEDWSWVVNRIAQFTQDHRAPLVIIRCHSGVRDNRVRPEVDRTSWQVGQSRYSVTWRAETCDWLTRLRAASGSFGSRSADPNRHPTTEPSRRACRGLVPKELSGARSRVNQSCVSAVGDCGFIAALARVHRSRQPMGFENALTWGHSRPLRSRCFGA